MTKSLNYWQVCYNDRHEMYNFSALPCSLAFYLFVSTLPSAIMSGQAFK